MQESIPWVLNEGNDITAKMKAMEVQGVLHMNEGSGETSYAKNSQVQVLLFPFSYFAP